jgi:hypothetical protein
MYYEKMAGHDAHLVGTPAAAAIDEKAAGREIERDRVPASHHLGQRHPPCPTWPHSARTSSLAPARHVVASAAEQQ